MTSIFYSLLMVLMMFSLPLLIMSSGPTACCKSNASQMSLLIMTAPSSWCHFHCQVLIVQLLYLQVSKVLVQLIWIWPLLKWACHVFPDADAYMLFLYFTTLSPLISYHIKYFDVNKRPKTITHWSGKE